MFLNLSERITLKLLEKHNVTAEEISQCFENREGGLLEDSREQHITIPPTQWFIAETDNGRVLKIVFIAFANGITEIKTAYEPNENEVKIYEKYA